MYAILRVLGQGGLPALAGCQILGQSLAGAAQDVCVRARHPTSVECRRQDSSLQRPLVSRERRTLACEYEYDGPVWLIRTFLSLGQFPSAVGHQLFRLIRSEGLQKVSYSLVSMRLPDPVLKTMQWVYTSLFNHLPTLFPSTLTWNLI